MSDSCSFTEINNVVVQENGWIRDSRGVIIGRTTERETSKSIQYRNKRNSVFLAVEGCDGSGKTTAVKFISQYLKDRNIYHQTSREPGSTNIAETIRECLFKCVSTDEEPMHPLTELLLINAARHQHLQNKILPTLWNGEWVICDRFNDSTWAYQHYAGGVPKEIVQQFDDLVIDYHKPDYTILLYADPSLIQDRIKGRDDNNGFDERAMEFKRKVAHGLLERSKGKPNYHIIDATKPIEEVNASIALFLDKIIIEQNSKKQV